MLVAISEAMLYNTHFLGPAVNLHFRQLVLRNPPPCPRRYTTQIVAEKDFLLSREVLLLELVLLESHQELCSLLMSFGSFPLATMHYALILFLFFDFSTSWRYSGERLCSSHLTSNRASVRFDATPPSIPTSGSSIILSNKNLHPLIW